MKKLKNKVFFTIFILLSVFLITILSINNYQNYTQSYKNISNNLKQFNENFINTKHDSNINPLDKPEEKNIERMMFMDSIIYSVKLDSNNNIQDITSHSINNDKSDNIESVARSIMSSNDSSKKYIGNLYINKYSYQYIINDSITIIDNTTINKHLLNVLRISIILFIILEIIIFIISKLITNWIIKPVVVSFNKQKQFIADASHELKTPLAVIMASSESLESDLSEKKWLYNIQNESVRMSKLITNLLDLAKLDSDEVKREYEKNNLSKIVEKSVLTFESITFEKNIKLDYDIQENIYLNSNGEEIKEVMSILLDNATKHCSKKGSININLKTIKSEIIIEVINTGEPIPSGEEKKYLKDFIELIKLEIETKIDMV